MALTPDEAYNAAVQRMHGLAVERQKFAQWQMNHTFDMQQKANAVSDWRFDQEYKQANDDTGILGSIFSGVTSGVTGALTGGLSMLASGSSSKPRAVEYQLPTQTSSTQSQQIPMSSGPSAFNPALSDYQAPNFNNQYLGFLNAQKAKAGQR